MYKTLILSTAVALALGTAREGYADAPKGFHEVLVDSRNEDFGRDWKQYYNF